MSSVIVFSKDRPMQLHAYLESLIWASGCQEEQIYVLYREEEPICYDKVKSYFPYVHWVAEKCFVKQLQEIITAADEYVMFGCDDVLFMDYFDLYETEQYLAGHSDIFGFSLRLGKNIQPMPKNLKRDEMYCIWDWTEATGHYGYPWELDCTLYRKEDVLQIIEKTGQENIKSPNYFESIPEENPGDFIHRKQLAAYYDRSKAIVVTVNRVQETHLNEVDSSQITDVLSLFIQYHYEDRILDLKKIRQYKYKRVHVGSEYFQLTPSVKQDVDLSGGVKAGKWRNLIQNARIASTGNLEMLFRKHLKDNMINAGLQSMAYSPGKPVVLGPNETVQKLTEEARSFCRFGDGEFTLMLGGGIGFQKYDPELVLRLWKIFCEENNNIYVGVPYQQFQMPDAFNDWIKEFYYTSGRWVRAFLNKYLPQKRDIYIDTGFNQVYQTYSAMNFAAYYENVRRLFQGKKIALLVGKDVLNKLSYDVFELAESVDYVYGPAKDAFSHYTEILEEALKLEHDRLVCVILGPTSKVLVSDLTKAGYMAWDIGHLAKDYDAYRKRLNRTREEIGRFYAPD